MAQGTQPNHYVTGKKDSVKTVASNKPTKEELRAAYEKAKKEGTIKSGEIISPAKAGKAIIEVATKVVKAVTGASKASKAADELEKSIATKSATFKARELESMQKSSNAVKTQKAKDLAEDERRIAQMARDKTPNKPKTQPNKKGPSAAPYNFLGN